jgi:hypothetical protein
LWLVRDSCLEDYPEYSKAAVLAMEYIEKERVYSRDKDSQPTEIPFAASKLSHISRVTEKQDKQQKAKPKAKRPSLFTLLRSGSWKSDKRDQPTRSMSVADPEKHSIAHAAAVPKPASKDSPEEEEPRSQSFSAFAGAYQSTAPPETQPETQPKETLSTQEHKTVPVDSAITRVNTSVSIDGLHLDKTASSISRHDKAIEILN